jgi:Family of unknown function (DUF5681)
MTIFENASHAAATGTTAGPVEQVSADEGGCKPLCQLVSEAAPAADAVASAQPVEAAAVSEAEADATSSGASSEKKPRGRPFEPGQSGNPAGRPKGARNRAGRAIEALIDGQGEALGAKAIEKALGGDSAMLRALMRTLVSPRRERTVEFDLPQIESAADAVKASAAVIRACAAGELSPREASEIMRLIAAHARIAALEKAPSEKTADDFGHDPIYGALLEWELQARRRTAEQAKGPQVK